MIAAASSGWWVFEPADPHCRTKYEFANLEIWKRVAGKLTTSGDLGWSASVRGDSEEASCVVESQRNPIAELRARLIRRSGKIPNCSTPKTERAITEIAEEVSVTGDQSSAGSFMYITTMTRR